MPIADTEKKKPAGFAAECSKGKHNERTNDSLSEGRIYGCYQ